MSLGTVARKPLSLDAASKPSPASSNSMTNPWRAIRSWRYPPFPKETVDSVLVFIRKKAIRTSSFPFACLSIETRELADSNVPVGISVNM